MSLAKVRTFAPDGSNSMWLNEEGPVSGLSWGSTTPGGYNQMACTLVRPPTFRTPAMNSGRIAQVIAGGSVVWDGKLDEGVPSSAGWAISAHGAGTFATEWDAIYTTWLDQNDAVNQAISRGLRWVNPGGNSIPNTVFLGQQVDSGSLKIADLLNLMCSKGGLVWQVARGNTLSVRAIPTTVTRLLVCTTPQPRTLAGDVNAIALRYLVSPDSAAAAVYATTFATVPASITAHGRMEDYDDLSSAGTMTAAAAQAVGNSSLAHYVRASWGGPFQVRYGQYLTTGGQPVDLQCEQAGEVAQLIITDAGYGGEVVPTPVTFPVGAFSYDETTALGTVTPYQYMSLSGLLSAAMLGPDLREDLRQIAAREAALDVRQAAAAARRRRALRREGARGRRRAAGARRRGAPA